jgi:hypothetical protein
MKKLYVILQCAAFITLITVGILRLIDPEFAYMNFINSLSILVALVVLLFSSKEKLEKEEMVFKKNIGAIKTIDLIIVFGLSLGLVIVVIANYLNLITKELGDFLSIFALALSLSSDFISSVVFRIVK